MSEQILAETPMPSTSVYLDHAATTPLDPAVLEAMLPYLRNEYGNASSVHGPGRRARGAVEESRETVAALLGAAPGEIVFTGGGTESNNLALRGCDSQAIVTSPVEHEAVLEPARWLASTGRRLSFAPVHDDGVVSADDLADTLGRLPEVRCLVSLMYVNNEIGAVNDIRALADVAHRYNAVMHTDAVQAVGLLDTYVNDLSADLLSLSAHKLYGPKGVGVLYVRSGVSIDSLQRGGPQERGRRAGTENVAGIVGMARALQLAVEHREERRSRIVALRERLAAGLQEEMGSEIILNSAAARDSLAPHIVNVSVRLESEEPTDAEMLLLNLDMEGVHASSGSACSSGTVRPSHVLEAIGRAPAEARAAVRFSIGKDTTEAAVDYTVDRFVHVVQRMRSIAS